MREYLARNNSRSRFFKGSNRNPSRSGSRTSNTTPNRFLNHRDEPPVQEGTLIQNEDIMKFHKEYLKVVASLQNDDVLFLSDILLRLNFLNNGNQRLMSLLNQQKKNFVIPNLSESVSSNLFKILCSILNLRPEQRERSQLDNKLLTTYLQNLSLNRDQNFQTIDKISTIKRLINRSSYHLDQRQIG